MKYVSDKAVILDRCFIGNNVYIGPYSVIGPDVKILDNTWIDSHVFIKGKCLIGHDNKFFKFSRIGCLSQYQKVFSKEGGVVIGDRNIFREGVIIYRGIFGNNMSTIIGNDNHFMLNSKIAHDSILGNNIVFSNNVSISGNVTIGDFSILSDFVIVYQNISIGSYSFVDKNSVLCKDVLPYTLVSGHPAKFKKLNLVILKRNFFSRSSILRLKKIYKLIFDGNLTVKQIIVLLLSEKYLSNESNMIVRFLLKARRGIIA